MTKMVLSTELDKAVREEMEKMMAALRQKHGDRPVLAATLMHNLLGVVRAGVTSIPDPKGKEEFKRIAIQVANDTMGILGAALQVKPDQVRPICEALDNYDDLVAGDHPEYLQEHEGAAQEVIAKMRAA